MERISITYGFYDFTIEIHHAFYSEPMDPRHCDSSDDARGGWDLSFTAYDDGEKVTDRDLLNRLHGPVIKYLEEVMYESNYD